MTKKQKQGDSTRDDIFHAVGMSLNSWENMEHTLADIFALLLGGDGDGAKRAFGTIATTSARQAMLLEAFNSYLGKHREHFEALPHLLNRVDTLANKRNNLAHGIVVFVDRGEETKGYFLTQSKYNSRKNFSFRGHYDAMVKLHEAGKSFDSLVHPKEYEWTADDIYEVNNAIIALHKELWDMHFKGFAAVHSQET